MKKLLSIAVSSLAFAAAADISPTIGVTEINPTLKNTVIPVTYSSLTNGNVAADSLVATTELDGDTLLYVFQNNSYSGWCIDKGKWEPMDSASTATGINVPDPNQTVPAGNAVWLIFPENKLLPGKVFVYGKVNTSKSWTIEHGKNNLLCNPTGAAMSGSTIATKLDSVLTRKDKIVPIGATYAGEYICNVKDNEKSWVYMAANGTITKNFDMSGLSIPAGGAFWYYSAKAGTTTTISLTD